jgi:DNA-binding winged helix-turn-helix (wHTH) protein
VDPSRNALLRGNDERHLEHRLMQTLVFLAENQGKIIPSTSRPYRASVIE